MESKKSAFIQMRTTIINRGQHLKFNEVPRSLLAPQGNVIFSDENLQSMYHSAVDNVLQLKLKESGDMQGLNARLASYIENVRFLEAQNKSLLAQNENLKKKKAYNSSEIKELYDRELEEHKKIINELSTEKLNHDAQVVALEEKLDTEKNEKQDLEKQNGDLKHSIDRLNSHIGDYDGELANFRMKVEFLEDEIDRLKNTNKRIRDENCRLQEDLDSETVKRLTTDNDLQAAREYYEFQIKVKDTEIDELRSKIDSEKSLDLSGIWKGQLSKAVIDIQTEYDRQLEHVRQEVEHRMNVQVQKIQSYMNRDNLETKQIKDENKLLKSKYDMMVSRIAELEAEISKYKINEQLMCEQKSQLELEYNAEIRRLQERVKDNERRTEAFVEELRVLQSAKLSLEAEITMYRKLLESEERKLNMSKNIEDTSLVEITQRKQYDEVQGNVKITKLCRSTVSISQASLDGSYVTIENTGKTRQDMKGWKLLRENEKGNITGEYVFGDVTLEAGKDVKIFTAGVESDVTGEDLSVDFYTWGAGSGQFKLFGTGNQDVMSSLSMEFHMDSDRDVRNS